MSELEIQSLRERTAALEAENARLRSALAEAEARGTNSVRESIFTAAPDSQPAVLPHTAGRSTPALTLADSEARLRSALTIPSVGGIYFDMEGKLLDANEAFLAMCGYSREDLEAGRLSWQALTPPEWLEVSWQAFHDLKTKGCTEPYEKEYFRKDGSRFWALFGATLVDDGRGFEFVVDITDRKRAEQALRAREAELRLIADAMPGLIAVIDRTCTYRFANAAYRTWFGRAPEEVVGRTLPELFGAEEFEARRPFLEQALAGTDTRLERNWTGADGRLRTADIRYMPRHSPDGEVIGLYVFVQDVTDRRRGEERLASRAQVLEAQVVERERDRDRIWTLSPVLKVVATQDGQIQAVNPSWTRSLGWSEAETVGSNFLGFVVPEERETTAAKLKQSAGGLLAADVETSLRTKEHGPRQISWTVVPEGATFYGFGRDITEQRHAEEALRQSQKLEAIGQLTGGVAHDFNNLLTIIRSSVEFLRRPELPEERKGRYLDAVSDTVERAAKLTGQLLAFARRQALQPTVFNVAERLGSLAEMLDSVTGARIRIATEIPDTPCFVRADISQFETALINMAVNARDAMNGEGTLTVSLACGVPMPSIRGHAGAPGPFVAVSLKDTGLGIAPDQIGRIFEPFFTTKEVGRGTGLGLSQVFGFAKQSGGDVSAESGLGEGATFTLYLPEAEGGLSEREASEEAAPLVVGSGQRVLVVEDNIEVGQFATQILEDLGYRTTWAANAEEALAALSEAGGTFDVLFSDVVMPGMGGIELAKLLRIRKPELPVVLTSGYSHVLAQEGAHGFELLQKPYSVEQVSGVLRRATARRSRRTQSG